ncbi:MAG: General secretory pathway protein E [Microgenomates group bacterium GW2011_GWC1_41_8]|uniref:Type II secretion system protein E n=3 Tax=Candidatus Roizmaniibacteriota TaxID=1752723 RepID=A0A0G0X9K6_9BACT|nr:MAG: Type II secretion system protein E [Candidatus Levybacteria bacterium GW2011_GWA2_40_16]KKR72033.1 MAG: Type II secretion system protein E [Candidatus Roizmanbacteria bacterium GW2011_GWB1_40_7]KKR94402.1 MAG: Type II secretion system protein E [Candidatus Roizmanbacteria bacterium GW2011_GWA1_41_13]KKS21077.1 MAG: Type II secretion system protein E [Candidatus Roizmanbacteria bacterium GW2011_GWC2_41_7]KKS22667.1 MAG: General secretory pathway protein E [Microgenomates group bacterium 
MPPARQSLLDILVENKKLDQKTAQQLKVQQLSSQEPIEKILHDRNLVSPEDILKARAKQLNVDYISIVNHAVPQELLEMVSEQVARQYKVLPVEYDHANETLHVAMQDPLDYQARQFLEKKTGKTIKPYLADATEIQAKIEEEYSKSLATEVSAAIKETITPRVKTVVAERIGELIREPPIARIVSTILEFAVKSRASDVHIEPQEQRTRVRYRIDGLLSEKLVLPKSVHEAVISRIKILSDMKIDERRIPQDGRFNFKMGEEETDLRVSTLPTIHGEKVVMRLLKKTGGIPDLPDLGLDGLALKNLEEAMTRPYGIILVTGPTGSGKTTTLYSVLSRINKIHTNIMTLEDPVEYQIAGINQVQINPGAGLTFASGLRSFLRQDPNIILVGEIRDKETAGLAVQAALTGHLVFSTLHTNNSSTAIPRLFDMEVESFLMASVLHAALAQRITRRICPHCIENYDPDPETAADIREVLGNLLPKNQKIVLARGKGCEECGHLGYRGRVGIFELLKVSENISKMIISHSSAGEIEKQARAEGMITMKQDGYLKVLAKVTTIQEVLRVAES